MGVRCHAMALPQQVGQGVHLGLGGIQHALGHVLRLSGQPLAQMVQR